ncbi:MAG: hypothetical protein ACFFBY_15250 [Promethearchaeota archaeon]
MTTIMEETYREIQVTCPVCSAVKSIGIPEKLFIQKKFSIIKVQIPQGGVCREHHFIVFVDDQGIIKKMARELMIPKPNRYRINLIKEFIKQRYSAKLAFKIKNKVEDFLSLL